MVTSERRKKMKKKMWIVLAMVFIIPGLMFSVSCQKKVVAEKTAVPEETQPEPQPAVEEKVEAPAPGLPAYMREPIYFAFDKSILTAASQANLTQKAEWLRENADATLTIEGHCDERGTNEYNLALGDRRAESAKAFLVDLGIATSRITTISYGEERPVCTEKNEECWAKNRRDEFIVN
jgi:peptidoglycan-associated lipoprotein